MSNEDGSIWITYNGEIYNFQDLRRELQAKGHRFASRTDTEVIVHLYEEEGPECVQRLDGMFAFGICDLRGCGPKVICRPRSFWNQAVLLRSTRALAGIRV